MVHNDRLSGSKLEKSGGLLNILGNTFRHFEQPYLVLYPEKPRTFLVRSGLLQMYERAALSAVNLNIDPGVLITRPCHNLMKLLTMVFAPRSEY